MSDADTFYYPTVDCTEWDLKFLTDFRNRLPIFIGLDYLLFSFFQVFVWHDTFPFFGVLFLLYRVMRMGRKYREICWNNVEICLVKVV